VAAVVARAVQVARARMVRERVREQELARVVLGTVAQTR